jgi:transposase
MPARKGPKKVNKYSNQLKRTAVRLSQAPGVKVKDVADALDIHPFMLSRWRKEARDGLLVEADRASKTAPKPKAVKKAKARAPSVVEMTKYAKLKKQLAQLQKEHDFLKKFDRFRAQLKAKGSPSSRGSGEDSE